jgi:hypothetical protein
VPDHGQCRTPDGLGVDAGQRAVRSSRGPGDQVGDPLDVRGHVRPAQADRTVFGQERQLARQVFGHRLPLDEDRDDRGARPVRLQQLAAHPVVGDGEPSHSPPPTDDHRQEPAGARPLDELALEPAPGAERDRVQ